MINIKTSSNTCKAGELFWDSLQLNIYKYILIYIFICRNTQVKYAYLFVDMPNNMDKFIFLINKEKYKKVIEYVFIGSLYDFQQKKNKLQIIYE